MMMQHGSCECSKSELDVQSVPPTMTAMHEGQWTEHYPIAPVKNTSAPIEFNIPPQTEKWTDLGQSYLYLKVKLKKIDGTEVDNEADKNVSVVNNLFHSLFSSVDLYLNNKLVTANADTYPYRAYIENLLSYNKASKDTHLMALEMWEEDTAGHMAGNTTDIRYAGWKSRRLRVFNKQCELAGRLHLDVALQDKYLPNGIEMRFRLNKTSSAFHLFWLFIRKSHQ